MDLEKHYSCSFRRYLVTYLFNFSNACKLEVYYQPDQPGCMNKRMPDENNLDSYHLSCGFWISNGHHLGDGKKCRIPGYMTQCSLVCFVFELLFEYEVHPHKLVCLNVWSPTGGTVLEDCGIFGRWSLDGRSVTGSGPWGWTARLHILSALCLPFLPLHNRLSPLEL